MRGKCAAIAVTVQAAAKANASRIMVRSSGMCGLTAAATAALTPTTGGSISQLIGRPIQDVRRRPRKAGVAPADLQPPRGQWPSDGRGSPRQGDAGSSGVPCRHRCGRARRRRRRRGPRPCRCRAGARREQNRYRVVKPSKASPPPARDWKSRERNGRRRDRSAGRCAAEHRRDDQRCREGGKDPVRGTPRSRAIGSARIAAGLSLRPASAWCRGHNDGKLALVH